MLTLAVDDPLRQPDIPISCALVKIAFGRCLEAARFLIDHIRNGPYVFKVHAISAYAVYADVANHKHSKFTFALGFCAHEPCEHLRIFGVRFDDCHRLYASLPSHTLGRFDARI